MEQRRSAGKSHWYHETQSSTLPQEVLPLVPQAADAEDRFLLDLAIPEEAQRPFDDWLAPARQLAHLLFPVHLLLNRMRTFSAYERMTTALTVAQVCGVQRLCNHYAARLAPLPGPDSSRESNHRLAQITQYARQLASSPYVIDARARQHLCDVGLTNQDIIVINQIIGYVGFQARVIALFQALLGHPVRWMPGLPSQQYADAARFADSKARWQPAADLLESRYASGEPLACQTRAGQLDELQPLASVLAHEPELLERLAALAGSSLRSVATTESTALVLLLSSRINGSVACFNELAQKRPELASTVATFRLDEAQIQRWQQQHPVERTLTQAIQLLTMAPDRFSAAHFTPLLGQNASTTQAIGALAWCGLCGWLNRLKIALGETH